MKQKSKSKDRTPEQKLQEVVNLCVKSLPPDKDYASQQEIGAMNLALDVILLINPGKESIAIAKKAAGRK